MRIRALFGLVAVAVLAAVGAVVGSVHQRALSSVSPPQAYSGVWYCPHGGGPGWSVDLSVTNPGSDRVSIRVSTYDRRTSSTGSMLSVAPRSVVHVPVKATAREAASEVEYFGGWVGVTWAARAGGGQSGIASEPCAPSLGRTWLMPDGSTLRGQDSWAIVMNPTAEPAVFSVTLDTATRPILTRDWSEFVLEPRRSVAFFLNSKALGRDPVGAAVRVQSGRVAAASLATGSAGGIREALGITAPTRGVLLPGGPDSGRTQVVIADAGTERATYRGTVRAESGAQGIGAFRGESLQSGQAKTYDLTTQPDTAVDVSLVSGDGLAVVRRSFGAGADSGATAGAAPARAWTVSAATFSRKDTWRLVLANPGSSTAVVKLFLLSTPGALRKPVLWTLRVYPGQTHLVGADFNSAAPHGSAVVLATGGSVVPLVASATTSGGYATAVGVPIPARWVPKRLP